MLRAVRLLLFCAALGGCSATSGGITSLTSIGGTSSSDMPSKAPVPPASSSQNSGNGGIWANFSSTFSSGDQPAQAPQKNSDEVVTGLDPNEALRLVNEYRSSKGLPALSLESHATAAAEILVKDMASHDHMSHAGPNGADLQKRLSMAGYRYRVAAENVGVGQRSFAEIVEGWKKSTPHSRNMLLAEAKHMGVAYEYKPDTQYKTYWTLVVAAP
jgi:uncharacterized protein YkwD